MIAGVVATLTDSAQRLQATLDDIAAQPQIELGALGDADRRIPLTIDSPDRRDVESVTKWLQEQPEVAFVDVVFVHLEDGDDRLPHEATASNGPPNIPGTSRNNRR